MKKYFLLSFLVLLPCLTKAEIRNKEQAQKIATEFLSGGQTKSVRLDLDMVWDGSDPVTRSVETSPAFYVFDNLAGPGFVIVSGDDLVRPIIGYSYDNEFDSENMAPHFISWMKEIAKQINYVRSTSTSASRAASDNGVGQDVLKHDTALWNQISPFNNMCPYDGDERSITGCVATAMAIVMKFHEWPDAGVGFIPSYVTNSKQISVPSIHLGHSYDWGNMLMSYSRGNETLEEQNAVARLMADCGAAVEMDYSSIASAAASENVAVAMVKYMKYDKSMILKYRGYFSDDEWHEMLRNELRTNGPVYYSGAAEDSGHAFVIDGYTDGDYYSVNWGWGGTLNGNFLLDALGGNGGQGYNVLQDALFNVSKDCGGEPEEFIIMPNGFQTDCDVFEVGEPFGLDMYWIVNSSSVVYNGRVAVHHIDAKGNIKEELWTEEVENLAPSEHYGLLSAEAVINVDIEPGDRLIAVFWNNQKGCWEKLRGYSVLTDIASIPVVEASSIEESISFAFNTQTREIELISKRRGVHMTITGPSGEVVFDDVTVPRGRYLIQSSDLAAGRYKITFSKRDEYDELYFVIGSKEEDSHE